MSGHDPGRRAALRTGLSCAAWLAVAQAAMPRALWAAFAREDGTHEVVAREPFGRLERVGRDAYALISTPFDGDRTTVANGGIVAGRSGVLVVEGLFTVGGAQWLAAQAKRLTGRWPTHVVLSHQHADHVAGTPAYLACGDGCAPPRVHATDATVRAVVERTPAPDPSLAAALRDAIRVSGDAPSVLDLGGRRVRIVPAAGHTASDLLVDLPDERLLFAGDLAWHGVFPNFVDAAPTTWRAALALLPASGDRYRTVPGHGAVMDDAAMSAYRGLHAELEAAARAAHAAGTPADVAARAWTIPASLGAWALFGPAFPPRAFQAWYRAFDAAR